MADLPKVVFPLYDGCTLLDFTGATQVFAWAGFAPVWAAKTCDPIKTTEDVHVLPAVTLDSLRNEPIEILFVPGGGPQDRKSTRLNSSHSAKSRMPSSA